MSNNGKDPKAGLSTVEVRVNSLSSTWMESEHKGGQRGCTELWRCRGSEGWAEVGAGRKMLSNVDHHMIPTST
jgi:hypothetical protein